MCLITDTGQFLLITQYQPLEAVAGCLRYDIAGRIALHRQARLPVPGMVGRTGGSLRRLSGGIVRLTADFGIPAINSPRLTFDTLSALDDRLLFRFTSVLLFQYSRIP